MDPVQLFCETLEKLSMKSQTILLYRHIQKMTLHEIAKEFKVSDEQIRLLQKDAENIIKRIYTYEK